MTHDSRVFFVSLETDQSNFESFAAALQQRYGKPTRQTVSTVKTKIGAEFTSRELLWSGDKVEISLDERSGSIDRSVAFFTDKALSRELEHQRSAAAANGAAKF